MDLQLKDKVALVIGSSSGLGHAIAMQLLEEGAKVVVCGRSLARLKAAYAATIDNEKLMLIEADITVQESVTHLIAAVITRFSALDILITNCEGPPLGEFEQFDLETWSTAYNSILLSSICLIKAALPYLKQSQQASILTITSLSAKQPLPGLILSNTFRPAVIGLTKSLSKELGKYHIRVNSILPGKILTQRLKASLDYQVQNNQSDIDKETKAALESIPLNRIGQPQEFAKVASFLVSPAASYLSGVMLQVDGGALQGL